MKVINNQRVCSVENCQNKSYSKSKCSDCRMKKLSRLHRRKKKLRQKQQDIRKNKILNKVLVYEDFKMEKGEGNTMSKLTEKDVLDIYSSQDSKSELSRRYPVSYETIRLIKLGRRWSWLTEPDDEKGHKD